MIVKDDNGVIVLRPGTHEPLVIEIRDSGRPWFALPDAFGEIAAEREAKPIWDWNPCYQVFQDGVASKVLCWKCGVPIKGWRRLLDGYGNPISIDGEPAVALKPYNHYRQGEFGCYLQNGLLIKFEYLHCADCTIMDVDGMDLWITHLAGLDHGMRYVRSLNLGGPSKDEWAQFMSRYSKSEPTVRVGQSKNARGKAA